MFNSIASFLFSFLFLSACNNAAKTEDPAKNDNLQTVSNDTVPVTKPATQADEYGCNTVEGETWSIVRKSCIRLLETGIKMEPQDPALDKTIPAWIVFTDDKVLVEIFLPTQKKHVIIRKSSGEGEPPKWANGPLTVSESNGIYTLHDEGKILYQGTLAK
jgi:hypothetical protein